MTPPTGKSGCTIESNISAGGQRIYHLPGSRDDARTCVNDRAGEWMFCAGVACDAYRS